MPNDSESWYIMEEKKWGLTEVFDGPFDSKKEAIRRSENAPSEGLFIQKGDFTKTSIYEGLRGI